MNAEKIRDRQRGCMYGLAIGDALGAAVEFRQPGEFQPVTGYRGFGPHGLGPGEWTDDTSMALALADSLANGFDERDQLKKYLDWFQNGAYSVNGTCFDIGNTTRHALYGFERDGLLEAADASEAASGNGSIMRLAPVPIKYWNDSKVAEYCDRSSRTTHASGQCRSACRFLGVVLADMITGMSFVEAVVLYPSLKLIESLHPLVAKVANGSYHLGNVRGSGWVVESLEAAMWAVSTTDNFRDAVLKAVNLGDDADTTGAVAGQLAGAMYGYGGIPQDLIDGLAKKDMIDKYLDPILTKG